MNQGSQNKTVVVGMSGGVDSSLTAALLKNQGFDVIGVTLQLRTHGPYDKTKDSCLESQHIQDARKVAGILGIPHHVVNEEELFKAHVVDDYLDSYLRGHTPLPCVRCNQKVKMETLLKVKEAFGARWLATGHYVQTHHQGGRSKLCRGLDKVRDQSFFLFMMTYPQLESFLAPLGQFSKAETRAQAQAMGIPVSKKTSSQDICFTTRASFGGLMDRLRPEAVKPGEIVDQSGKVLGQHKGLMYFTVGQRRGLQVSSQEPLYVLRLDGETNQVVVGKKEDLVCPSLDLDQVNWTDPFFLEALELHTPHPLTAKIRSVADPQPVHVTLQANKKATVQFQDPEYGAAPGQACVFYQGDQLVGGGWISS